MANLTPRQLDLIRGGQTTIDGQTFNTVLNISGGSSEDDNAGSAWGTPDRTTIVAIRRDVVPGNHAVGARYEIYTPNGESRGFDTYKPKTFMGEYLPFVMFVAALAGAAAGVGSAVTAGGTTGASSVGGIVAGDAFLPGALASTGGAAVPYGGILAGLEASVLPLGAGGAAVASTASASTSSLPSLSTLATTAAKFVAPVLSLIGAATGGGGDAAKPTYLVTTTPGAEDLAHQIVPGVSNGALLLVAGLAVIVLLID